MQGINIMLNPYSIVSAKFTTINISYNPGWRDSSLIPYRYIIDKLAPILSTRIINSTIEQNTLVLRLEGPHSFTNNADFTRFSKSLVIQGQVVVFSFSSEDTFYNMTFHEASFADLVKHLLDSPLVADFRLFSFNERSLRCNVRLVAAVKPHLLFPDLKYFTKSITSEDYLSNNYLFLGESSYVTLRHNDSNVITGKIIELTDLEAFYHAFDRVVLLIQAWDNKNIYVTVR